MYPEMPFYKEQSETKMKKLTFPPQHQSQMPAMESQMNPFPIYDNSEYKGSGKLKGKTAILTGGDSGIGRAVAVAFAKEGADLVIAYLNEHEDANVTKAAAESYGVTCTLVPIDLREQQSAQKVVDQALTTHGKIDVLVNNCAVQFIQKSILNITKEQLDQTFQTNFYSYFFMIQAVLPHLKKGAAIINTASITAYKGNQELIDYSATKGAIIALTRSLSTSLAAQDIRVNAVAPGPIWTPLIPGSFDENKVSSFGSDTPMKRAGQPFELAPGYVYLASDDSRFMTGQTLHINGGEIING
ncbi:SDR family oxidoreductase [Pullulanibacillus pueri]|uniref:NAD(P)-dependent oxidoreductase n=1 Tax=Pullulanibacillus pueri TaxID=1437324 RepID=A0A8J3EK02_9BACL|nr:SDR family oxidoreductase [Pullulanibacillus pueri]GGH73989.1 NAD(P)-dependent oxidoreductase [Pullulanibacillus pueri]